MNKRTRNKIGKKIKARHIAYTERLVDNGHSCMAGELELLKNESYEYFYRQEH